MKPSVPSLTDEVWLSLCEVDGVRPPAVAAGRARLASNDWPEPLAVADAVLGNQPCPSTATA